MNDIQPQVAALARELVGKAMGSKDAASRRAQKSCRTGMCRQIAGGGTASYHAYSEMVHQRFRWIPPRLKSVERVLYELFYQLEDGVRAAGGRIGALHKIETTVSKGLMQVVRARYSLHAKLVKRATEFPRMRAEKGTRDGSYSFQWA